MKSIILSLIGVLGLMLTHATAQETMQFTFIGNAVVGNLKCRVFRNEEYNGFGNNQYIDFGNNEYRGSKFSGLIQSDQK